MMNFKNEDGNIVIEGVGLTFKLLVISVIFFQLSVYLIMVSRLNIAIDETIRRASIEGCIRKEYLYEQLSHQGIDSNLVTIIDVEPSLDKRVKNLGDRLFLEIKLRYPVEFSSMWNLNTYITYRKEGINEGYYGEGYFKD